MREKSKATSSKTAKSSGFLKPCASGSRSKRRSKTGLVDMCLIVKSTCTWGLNKKRKKSRREAAWPQILFSAVKQGKRSLHWT